jgi:adenosylcobinamide kinase/adenosylcobinamide-phosphate guanylyltransferase
MAGRFVFVLGGARSGKSAFTLRLAEKLKGKKAFIATLGRPHGNQDREMALRASLHKKERGPGWKTFEEPLHVAALLDELKAGEHYRVIVIDCLTLWLTNLMLAGGGKPATAGQELIKAIGRCGADVFAVSNEVGLSIVPESALGRRFRDEAGRLNQRMAAAADEVYILVAGIPLKLKGDRDGGA